MNGTATMILSAQSAALAVPMKAAAAQSVGLTAAAGRAGLDVMSVAVLTLGLFLPRHHRRDLVTVFWLFNTTLLSVLLVINSGQIGVGAGLGLFGVLSIVRLRSEQYRNVEIGYFFVALALALVNGLAPGVLLPVLLSTGILVVVLLVDSNRLLPCTRYVQVVLDQILEDETELRAELSARLGGVVVQAGVTQIDYVRLVMVLNVLYRPAAKQVAPGIKQPTGPVARVQQWATR